MPQYTAQLGDALGAFKTVLAALTYPTSSDPVFPTVALLRPGEEFRVVKDYPQAIIRLNGGNLDDDNGIDRHNLNFSVEIRVKRETYDDAESPLYGTNRTSDEALGAGLVDMLAKLVSGVGYLTASDNAEILSYINYTGFNDLPGNKDHCAWQANFEANLNIV